MGKFSSKPKLSPPIELPSPTLTADAAREREAEEAGRAANRLRISERRRRGRRSAILSNISDEEAQLATVKRPAGRVASVLFGG